MSWKGQTNSNPQIRKQSTVRTFLDLPPRVIIHEIFSRFQLESPTPPENETEVDKKEKYAHFGYFTADRMRNIWFLFSNLKIIRKPYAYLDYERITVLKIKKPSDKFSLQLHEFSSLMRSLEVLEIQTGEITNIRNLFAKKGCFPNVHTLTVSLGGLCGTIFKEEWSICEETNIFGRIRSLCLESDEDYMDYTVQPNGRDWSKSNFCEHNVDVIINKLGQNIENLSLSKISLPKLVHLKLPNLKSLNIHNGKNILIDPFEIEKTRKLKKLRWVICDLDFEQLHRSFVKRHQIRNIERVYREAVNLEEIELFFFDNEGWRTDSSTEIESQIKTWIFKPGLNPLKFLEKIEVHCEANSDIKSTFLHRESFLGKNLRVLFLQMSPRYPNFEHFFLSQYEYPNLEFFKLQTPPQPTTEWKILRNVREFNLVPFEYVMESENSEGHMTTVDPFFQHNKFLKLEKFGISYRFGNTPCAVVITGEDWNPLERLNELNITGVCVTDGVFKGNRLGERLKKLSLRNTPIIRGRDWNPNVLERLEELKLDTCENVTNELFQNDFSNLRKLLLKGSRRLSIASVPNFLMLDSVPDVKSVTEAVSNEYLTGENWGPFPKLEDLEISNTPMKNGDLFTSRKLENLRTLVIGENTNITRELVPIWNVPNLKILKVLDTNSISKEGLREDCKIIQMKKERSGCVVM